MQLPFGKLTIQSGTQPYFWQANRHALFCASCKLVHFERSGSEDRAFSLNTFDCHKAKKNVNLNTSGRDAYKGVAEGDLADEHEGALQIVGIVLLPHSSRLQLAHQQGLAPSDQQNLQHTGTLSQNFKSKCLSRICSNHGGCEKARGMSNVRSSRKTNLDNALEDRESLSRDKLVF